MLKDAGPCKDVFWTVNTSSLTISNWSSSTVEYSHWVLVYPLIIAVWLWQTVPQHGGGLLDPSTTDLAREPASPPTLASSTSVVLARSPMGVAAAQLTAAPTTFPGVLQHYFVLHPGLDTYIFSNGNILNCDKREVSHGKVSFSAKQQFHENFQEMWKYWFCLHLPIFKIKNYWVFFPFSQVFLFHSLLSSPPPLNFSSICLPGKVQCSDILSKSSFFHCLTFQNFTLEKLENGKQKELWKQKCWFF